MASSSCGRVWGHEQVVIEVEKVDKVDKDGFGGFGGSGSIVGGPTSIVVVKASLGTIEGEPVASSGLGPVSGPV